MSKKHIVLVVRFCSNLLQKVFVIYSYTPGEPLFATAEEVLRFREGFV